MIDLSPPKTPSFVVLTGDGGLGRLHFRLWQVLMSAITVLVTAWFCTFGAVSAIVAVMVAKHVLVAIFIAGLHLPPSRKLNFDRH